MVDLCVDVEAPILLDAEVVGFGFGVRRATARRRSALALGGRRAKPWTQDEVDDPLVGGSTVFERDFLGQDVHPQNRFGGQVTNLAKAGDAPPIDQNQRHPAAAARRIGLRGNRGQQVGDRRNAIAADVGGAQLELGLDVTRNRPRLPPGGDDDLVLGRCLLGEARRGRENHQGCRPNFWKHAHHLNPNPFAYGLRRHDPPRSLGRKPGGGDTDICQLCFGMMTPRR